MGEFTQEGARALDAVDELYSFRKSFVLPSGRIYLDGNSLGAMPRASIKRLLQVAESQWGSDLVRSWNIHDWMNSPASLGAKVAQIIGAFDDEVVVTDSTSVNLFKLVVAALEMRPGRAVLLSETGNFPNDLYVCEGAVKMFGRGTELKTVPRDKIAESIDKGTALLLLTHVHYKSSEAFDLAEITRLAHEHGALILWDLSHSAGALPLKVTAAQVDFAVGCGYKYLNGGPGAPAYLYVARRHQRLAHNAISGWIGHAEPFAFNDQYKPATGIRRFLSGTPSIIANSVLEVGLDLVLEAGIEHLAAKSRRLAEYFIALIESRCFGFGLKLVSPREAERRGSHVSYSHAYAYEIMQALISENVVGDFRAPDVGRFGFAPLYIGFEDLWIAVDRLLKILETEQWRSPQYAVRTAVT